MTAQKGTYMFDFNECKTAANVKTKVRETAFSDLVEAFSEKYGADNVSVVGASEIAVCIGTRTLTDGTEGEVCFTVKPVAKDFDIRTADSGKVFLPYERLAEADAYEVEKTEKEEKALAAAKKREEKKKADAAARAKLKAEKEAKKNA